MADRQEATVSSTGVWVDTQTGQVVESEPVEGKLLVPPGGEIDQRIRDDIDSAKLAAGPVPVDDDVAEKGDDESDETETSAETEPAPARRGRPPGGKNKATVADSTEKATE